MGLRINTNVVALGARNQLAKTTTKLATSLERLSSGLRINSGKDDVVGLMKSESLRAQIRGIGAAELNLSNGRSLLGVAEGSLSQLTDIAQRLRELAVQASDDTISSTDRDNLATAVSDLTSEFTRLANASSFDGVALLSGTFSNKSFQAGPNSNDTISLSISDSRASMVGGVAIVTAITLTHVMGTDTEVSLTDISSLTLAGVSLSTSDLANDGVSFDEADESALAYVTWINKYSAQTGVQAQVIANTQTLANSTAISANTTLFINGIAIDNAAYASSAAGTSSLASAINLKQAQTGVTATYSSTSLILRAADGRNITLRFSGQSVATATYLGTSVISQATTAAATIYRGTFRMYKDSSFSYTNGAAVINTATTAQTVSVSTTNTLSNVNVASSMNASTAIFILDNTIRQLQQRRTDVGSKAVRMDAAIAELQARKENFTSAESVIRDADVALETANLTSNQILSQAGASVLQRANAMPQIALTLLQQ